ncbi:surf-like protein [Sticta canariensis]|nr:surf-like protein [Sticta canariensis]
MRSKLVLHTLLECKCQANPRKLLQNPSWLRYQRGQRFARIPAEDPDFLSVVDKPPNIAKQPVSFGTYANANAVAALIPITAFALGTWQVLRLGWKTDLIARFEDRLIRKPLPLPPRIDPSAIKDFDYRRVYTTGRLRHDQEMLIGPRIRDGSNGYLVVTPLERDDNASTVLVNRGWIPKRLQNQADRKESLLQGHVMVEGLLREPWRKNIFTPANKPEKGEFYFPDVEQMAKFTGSEPVWIEETMEPDLLKAYDREAKGIPIGRPAEVNLRNNHTQYIFTCLNAPSLTTYSQMAVFEDDEAAPGASTDEPRRTSSRGSQMSLPA